VRVRLVGMRFADPAGETVTVRHSLCTRQDWVESFQQLNGDTMKDVDRRSILIDFWRKRQPPDQRTGADLLVFYNRLEANRPELLKRGYGDPYQTAKSRSEWPR
jgi:hypothetical protein